MPAARATEHAKSLEPRPTRGNLRLFFGGAGGASALRVMLKTAAAARAKGTDVVIAMVHRNRCLAQGDLPCGIEQLPPPAVSRQFAVQGLDTAAVLQRRPDLLLVDIRPTRGRDERDLQQSVDRSWHDIEALLEAGIHVWAPLDASGFSSWAFCQPQRRRTPRRRSK